MPQPLKRLISGQFSYIGQMPIHHHELCAHAMGVIAGWSEVEVAVLNLITTMLPGRAGSMAEFYTQLNSDGPKRAMLDALATALMLDPEIAVYEKLMARYQSSYSLRNPLAHWILGHSPNIPDAIIATDARAYQRYLAAQTDASNRPNPTYESIMASVNRSHEMLRDSQVYRLKDLTDIRAHIGKTQGYFLEFKFILNWRMSDSHPKKRHELFASLARELGLP